MFPPPPFGNLSQIFPFFFGDGSPEETTEVVKIGAATCGGMVAYYWLFPVEPVELEVEVTVNVELGDETEKVPEEETEKVAIEEAEKVAKEEAEKTTEEEMMEDADTEPTPGCPFS